MTSAQAATEAIPARPHTDSEPLEQPADRERNEDELIESELLVEDVSIDGMCGVY